MTFEVVGDLGRHLHGYRARIITARRG